MSTIDVVPRALSPIDARVARQRLEASAEGGELDQVCRRLGVRLLGIFGSATRDDSRAPDDLDVAVSFAGTPLLLELIDELVRITGFDGIDVTVIDNAEPVLRAEALTGRPLFESEPGAFAVAQMAALAEKWDTAWLRELDLDRLAR